MSLPAWAALTAYGLYARVTPTADTTRVFSVSTAGTSAAAEPTWPTAAPWTVTDGTVTWGLASSFRMNTVAGLVSALTAFQTANPTLLAAVSNGRPRSLSNISKPAAWIAGRNETITHANQIRTRTQAGLQVVVADIIPDNIEAEARMDQLIDGLMDLFTLNFHAASGYAITEQTAVSETTIDEHGVVYLANIISFASSKLTEGRA